MKNKTLIAFLLMVAWPIQVLLAQNQVRYENFTLTAAQGVVRIDFTLLQGSTCNGIRIYRSTDSTQLVYIGEIAGNCGSIAEPVSYFYIDYNPIFNAKTYYRLDFGSANQSALRDITITSLLNGEVQIRPHPVNTLAEVHFENLRNDFRIIKLYNMQGVEVYRATTNEQQISLDAGPYSPGIYQLLIYDADGRTLAQEKMIISH